MIAFFNFSQLPQLHPAHYLRKTSFKHVYTRAILLSRSSCFKPCCFVFFGGFHTVCFYNFCHLRKRWSCLTYRQYVIVVNVFFFLRLSFSLVTRVKHDYIVQVTFYMDQYERSLNGFVLIRVLALNPFQLFVNRSFVYYCEIGAPLSWVLISLADFYCGKKLRLQPQDERSSE